MANIGQNLIYLFEFVIIVLGLYVLRFRTKSTLTKLRDNLFIYQQTQDLKNIKTVVLVQIDPSKPGYENDKYLVYDVDEDHKFTYNSDLSMSKAPALDYFDVQEQRFAFRRLQELFNVDLISPKKVRYHHIGESEVAEGFGFEFQRRIGNLIDTEYKLVKRNECRDNADKNLPITRQEYNKFLGIDDIGFVSDFMFSGYKVCRDDTRYDVHKCVRGEYFSHKDSVCKPFMGNRAIFSSAPDVQKFLREN